MRGRVAAFRLYLPRLSGSRYRRFAGPRGFWDVVIFDTAASLRDYIASTKMRGGKFVGGKRAIGICRALITLRKSGGYKPNPRGSRGVVMLCLSACGVGIVSHELTHAAHYELASHQGREPLTLKDDERLAYLQGEMVRRFWNAFYRRFKQRGRQWVAA